MANKTTLEERLDMINTRLNIERITNIEDFKNTLGSKYLLFSELNSKKIYTLTEFNKMYEDVDVFGKNDFHFLGESVHYQDLSRLQFGEKTVTMETKIQMAMYDNKEDFVKKIKALEIFQKRHLLFRWSNNLDGGFVIYDSDLHGKLPVFFYVYAIDISKTEKTVTVDSPPVPQARVASQVSSASPTKIFVFDLDLTLIDYHTGGVYNRNPKRTTNSRLEELKQMLNRLKESGIILFLNTRGNYISALMLLEDIGFIDLFTNGDGSINVYAAEIPASSFGYEIMEEYMGEDLESSIPIGDGNDMWAEYKTYFLQALVKKYDIQKQNVIFFDDTNLNIDKAKENGFSNSYNVTAPNNLIQLLTPFMPETEVEIADAPAAQEEPEAAAAQEEPEITQPAYKFGDVTRSVIRRSSTAQAVTNAIGNAASKAGEFLGIKKGGKKTIKRNKKKHSKKINRKPRKTIKRKNRISNKTNNKK